MNNSVEIVNVIVGGFVSIILYWIKIQNDKQTKKVAEILKTTTSEQSSKADSIISSLTTTTREINEAKEVVREAIKIAADTVQMEVNSKNMVINTFAHNKYLELLDEHRKSTQRIADITKNPDDIRTAQLALEAYEKIGKL